MTEQRIETWSYSRLKDYEQCPYKAFLKYSEKRPDTSDRTAANRGTMIHDAAEQFVRGEGPAIDEMKHFMNDFEEVAELYQEGKVEVEQDWGFTQDWTPTGWHDDDVWCRMKLDQFIWVDDERTAARARDLKSGKKYGNEISHNQQGQLYTIGSFLRYPTLQAVSCEFLYLDQKAETKKQYTREKAMKLWPRWHERALAMTEATSFPPKPNKINCRFCPYGTNKGDGSCEYGVDA